ncbi:undecaprenyl-phosphate glucose phosphotransferase [Rhodobacteraceae bacterium RKSG542]|nr:undecaprenyl-phosphate glucose phosphotransferase [Pseudovibrio flavus]
MKAGKAKGLSPEAIAMAASLAHDTISQSVLIGSVRLTDALIIALSGYIALYSVTSNLVPDMIAALAMFAALPFTIMLFHISEIYEPKRLARPSSQALRLFMGWTIVFAVGSSFSMLAIPSSSLPHDALLRWYGLGFVSLAVFHVVLSHYTSKWVKNGQLTRRALLVGGGNAAADLIADLERQPDNDITICGIFDDRGNDRSPPSVAGYQKLGSISDLVEFARIAKIDILLVTIPMRAEKRILELLEKLWVLPVDIRLSAHSEKMRFRNRASSFVGTIPFVDVMQKPIADWDYISKRIFDIVIASASLVALSPVFLITALMIKLDSSGPVIFRQKRYGFNNELIEIYKFRSMYQDMTDKNAANLVTKSDPRVTKVGRFIRKSSIDELPQLLNVLRGELSLVGPRPHALSAKAENHLYEQVVDGYFARHKVKPGVTGWAQINGWRGETDTQEKIQKRVEYDLYYIENWSVLFDLYILIKTPFSLLNTENAY